MTYKELQTLKTLIQKFREDKTKYNEYDILDRMRIKLSEEMALVGYQHIENRNTTVEEMFVGRFKELLESKKKKIFYGNDYVRISDINEILKKLLNGLFSDEQF